MAAGNNPFALGNAPPAGPRAPVVAREYTPDQQLEKLRGYVKVKPELYRFIDVGKHVRYYTKDKRRSNGFKIGGYVSNVIPGPPDAPPIGLYLTSSPHGGQGATGWPVKFANVDKVYVKMDVAWHLARQGTITRAEFRAFGEGVNERLLALDARLQAVEKALARRR